jgi:TonB family protein
MRAPRPRHRLLRVSLAVVGAGIAAASACAPRLFTNLEAPSARAVVDESMTPLPASSAITAPNGDHGASMLPNHMNEPKYPAEARAAKATGHVAVMYVVNADGTVDTATFKVTSVEASEAAPTGTKDAFVAAVRVALKDFRYVPASVGGKNVRQLVRASFEFKLAGAAPVTSRMPTRPTPATVGVDAATGAEKPYFDFQVEAPATPLAGSKGPRYPQALRDAKVEGQVLAQFVVDTTGAPDMRTFKVLKTDHADFSEAVREALPDMRFAPARVGGKAVKQLMQTPFQFSLSR